MDRVHRLGQVKDVEVVRFICKDSVEEKIMELQNVKREMTTVTKQDTHRNRGKTGLAHSDLGAHLQLFFLS